MKYEKDKIMSKDLYENNRNMLEKVNHISKIKIQTKQTLL